MWSGAGGRNGHFLQSLTLHPVKQIVLDHGVELKSLLDIALSQVGRFNKPIEGRRDDKELHLIYFLEKAGSGFDGLLAKL